MKVAYILTCFPSRSETFALREIRCMRDMGWDITVLAAERSDGEPDRTDGLAVFYRPSVFSMESLVSMVRFLWRYPFGLARLASLLLRLSLESPRECLMLLGNLHTVAYFAGCLDRQEIGHVHGYFLSWPACIGLALGRLTGRSLSLAGHARDIFVDSRAVKAKTRAARFIVTCTRQGLERLQELLPSRHHAKLHLIRHGIGTGGQPAAGRSDGRQLPTGRKGADIIAVGRMVPKKGLEHLARAIAGLRRDLPQCRAIIVGDGPGRRRLEETILSLGLGDCVELTGWIDNDAVISAMRSATVLVVPSVVSRDGDRDGIPNVILEAFACGLPVIASRLPGIAEAVEHMRTGILVAPADVDDLRSALARLLPNERMRARLSGQAREYVAEHFDITRNVRKIADLFEDAVA